MNSSSTANFFVYGTLCRGQCRSHLWPAKPLFVVRSWVEGRLYGRPDYPAMIKIEPDHRVLGELWGFDPKCAETITKVLDEIEETNQIGRRNLYDRVETEVHLLEPPGGVLAAQCYCYARNPLRDGFGLLEPGPDGFVSWPVVQSS